MLEAFRAEVRAWLTANARPRRGPADWSNGPRDATWEAECDHLERCRAWQRTLFDGGWAGITWPVEHGGRGGTPAEAIVFDEEQAAFDVTSGFLASSIALVGPTLLAHGTPEQRAQHLRPLLRGDTVWCQLFSEPGAGSDLASLRTSAELVAVAGDRDELVVNGQKVWTSGARHADFAILLVRTDPHVPKHRGITYLLLDMTTPGIEIRPLRQINGASHFNEVFLTDVRVPVENVVGELHGGWVPARTTLANESALIGSSTGSGVDAAALVALARAAGHAGEPVVRQRLAEAWTRERVLGWLRDRVQTELLAGRPPSIDGSVLKLAWSHDRAEKGELAIALLGATGTLAGADTERGGFWQTLLLNRFWASIGGGTDEIHRTMVGERALGLPAEPRVDRDAPFSEP